MTARTDDYDEIVRVVQLYVDGFNHNEAGKFREAFDVRGFSTSTPMASCTKTSSLRISRNGPRRRAEGW
jgi:hypothetical protein